MKKILIAVLLTTIALSGFTNNKTLSTTAKFQLQVIDVEEAQKEIISFLKKKGGYFTNRDNRFMQIKILPQNLKYLTKFLTDKYLIVSKTINQKNYQDNIHNLEITIATQTKSLNQILKILNQANFSQTLDIEQRIQAKIEKIERAKGRLRWIKEHIRFTYVSLNFKSYTSRVRRNLRSPFKWINQLRLENLFRGF